METHKKDGKVDKAADQNMLQNLQLLALASLQPGTPVSAGQMYEPSILAGRKLFFISVYHLLNKIF